VRAGYVTEAQIPNVVSLWPLILIGIGVGILLARTRYALLGGLYLLGLWLVRELRGEDVRRLLMLVRPSTRA